METRSMFANRMKHLESSGIRKMFELKTKMKNPIDLSLGQADFDVPKRVKEAAIRAIREGKNGYTMTTGIPELRKAIADSLKKEGVEAESMLVVSGASGALALSLLALADESVEVLVTDPCFVTYIQQIRLAGATPRWIDTYPDFRLTPERLEAAVTPKSRILLFNSPVNPTGIHYTPDEIKALAKTAQRLGLQVISDEVYDRFGYDHPHECWLKHDSGGVLIRAFSKTLGMAGWRIGFAAGPKAIIDHMTTLQQFTFICINTPAQWACVKALQTKLPDFQKIYRKKRDLVLEGLSKAFSFKRPEGAFYVFPEYPAGDGDRFIDECLKNELLVVPGKAFSRQNTHFRISFATDNRTLKRGIDLLVRLAR